MMTKMKKMKNFLQRFWQEEDGMGTVEIVIIIAVLVAVALLFKDGIEDFVNKLMDDFFVAPEKPKMERTDG